MSFDIQLSDGDIIFDTAGNLTCVTDTNKLAQDIMKILYTTVGADPFNSFYGSWLTDESIGSTILPGTLTMQAETSISDSLLMLQQNQAEQKLYQVVTTAEILASIADLSVIQSIDDARQYNVLLTILSLDLTPITLEFHFQI